MKINVVEVEFSFLSLFFQPQIGMPIIIYWRLKVGKYSINSSYLHGAELVFMCKLVGEEGTEDIDFILPSLLHFQICFVWLWRGNAGSSYFVLPDARTSFIVVETLMICRWCQLESTNAQVTGILNVFHS